jgi:hypothetical protein
VRWMETHAKRGWHISDLHRHPMAWAGFRALSTVMGLHPIVQHDGGVSVRRGFTRSDWERILEEADIARDATIAWWFPFRFCVSQVC